MSGAVLHTGFDVIAWLAAALSFYWVTRRTGQQFPASPPGDWRYFAVLVFGGGGVLFGTANLWLSHQSGLGRSIEGAIAGAILAVELYKRSAHITARTGARFALPLAVGIAVGRIGCFLAGLDDFTYGTPTALPRGATILATAFPATRFSFTRAPPWPFSSLRTLFACARTTAS